MTRSYQPSFAGGVLSAGMYARSDVTKYQVGLKDARNVFVRAQGGVANRPGFRSAGAPLTAKPRLIPFQFSADQTYVLEFSFGVFKVFYQGGYVLDDAIATLTITSIAGGEFKTAGTKPPVGSIVYLSGNSRFPAALVRVTATTGTGFSGEVAGLASTAIADGATPGLTAQRVYSQTHPYALSELAAVNFAQDGNDLYLVHENHPPHLIRRVDHDQWTSAPVVFAPALPAPDMTQVSVNITAVQYTADEPWFTAPGHTFAVGEGVTIQRRPGAAEPGPGWFGLLYAAFRVTEVSGAQVRLRRVDGKAVNTSSAEPHSDLLRFVQGAPGVWRGSTDENPNPLEYRYRIAMETKEGEEGPAGTPIANFFDLTVEGNTIVPVWPPQALPAGGRYVVYKETGGVYGYIGTTDRNYFLDTNIAPDTGQGPQSLRNPFVGTGNYPRVIAFHEQRLFLAATKNDPQLVEASQSGRSLNFSVSRPPRDSDAITFRPRYKEANEVRALVSGPQLLLMTSGGEWLVSGGNDVALTPLNLFLRPVSYWGSDPLPPVVIGDVLMFVQRGGRVIRDLPIRSADTEARPTDVTVMSADLFRSAPIASWAYAPAPYSLLWVALADGTLLSLTYLAAEDVWGWAPHELGGGGEVRQLVTVHENDQNAVYAVVERGGRWHTERMDARSDDAVEGLYLDAGMTARPGAPVHEIEGLWGFAGQTVTALVDGNVFKGLTVTADGRLALPHETTGTVWHVGHDYPVYAETLPIDLGAVRGVGSVRGNLTRLSDVIVLVERTRGIRAGRDHDSLEELKEWGAIYPDRLQAEEVGVYKISVQGDWLRAATVVVDHPYPLPFTLLGVAPQWEVGG